MPTHDLAALWEAHTRTEFETRDVDATMASMVDQPYVNHIPTMAGGVGHDELKRFYKYHFIGGNPPDTSLALISRTVGLVGHIGEELSSPITPVIRRGLFTASSHGHPSAREDGD